MLRLFIKRSPIHFKTKEMKDISMFILGMSLASLLFFDIVLVLYFSQVLGSAANGMLMWTIYKVFRFSFEIPTGWISDVFGRAKSMVFSCLSLIIGLTIYYFAFDWTTMIIGAVFMGFGFCLSDGPGSSYIYEGLVCSGRKDDFAKIENYYWGLTSLTYGVGSVAGGILAAIYGYKLVFIISVIPVFLAMLIFLRLEDPKRCHAKKSEQKGLMWKSLKDLVSNKKIRYLAFGRFFHYAEGVLRYDALPVFLKTFIPLNLISVFWGIREVLCSISCLFVWRFSGAPKRVRTDKLRLQFSVFAIALLSVLAVVFKFPIWSLILISLTVIPVTLQETVYTRIFHSKFKSKQRAEQASWLSAGSQLSELLMGAVLSLMLRFYDIQTTFLILVSVICVLNIYFYGKAFRKTA